jgi:F-type H+-transporting ATPase subunit b
MAALGINIGYLLVQILGIVILLLLLRGLAYDPILRILEERKARIAKGLEDARQAAIARDNAEAEAKKILDAARAEAAGVRSNAVTEAEQSRTAILAKANEEAREALAAAQTDAEEERNRILAGMRGQIASISIAAANKLVGEALDEKRQHALIKDFFSKVPTSVRGMSGSKAVVTSALPLSSEEQANAKSALGISDVDFRVDPTILGGLVVRVGDQVIDDSVAGKMNSMRDSMR